MKKVKSWIVVVLATLVGMLLGYWLGSISLFTGIGFSIGLGYGFILNKDA